MTERKFVAGTKIRCIKTFVPTMPVCGEGVEPHHGLEGASYSVWDRYPRDSDNPGYIVFAELPARVGWVYASRFEEIPR